MSARTIKSLSVTTFRKVPSTFASLTGVDIFYTRLLFFMFFSVKLAFVVDINPRTMFFIPQEEKNLEITDACILTGTFLSDQIAFNGIRNT